MMMMDRVGFEFEHGKNDADKAAFDLLFVLKSCVTGACGNIRIYLSSFVQGFILTTNFFKRF